MSNFKVDFIGVGFPRCGTTWISKCLEEHPEICFSNKKEVQFFNIDYDYKKGIDYYRSFFNHKKSEKIVGEFTPEYYMYKKTYDRIRKDCPNAKLIFSVRNPIDRAFSHYLYRKRKTGKEYPIGEVFTQENLPPEEQILFHGFYYHHLSRWLKNIPKDQYLIVVHEDSKEDPIAFIQKIYRFLGVKENFIPQSLNQETNTSKGLNYRSRFIQNIYAYRTKIKRNNFGRKVVEFLKKLGLSRVVALIISWNFKGSQSGEKEVLSSEMRKKIREVYEDDIKSLEQFMNRRFSSWK